MSVAAPPEPLLRAFLALGVVVFAATILYFGRSVLLPVAAAIFVWFVLNAIAAALRRLPAIGPRIPPWAAVAVAALGLAILGAMAVQSAVRMAGSFGSGPAAFEGALDPLVDWIAATAGLERQAVLDGMADRVGIEALLGLIAAGAIDLIGSFGVVAIYVGFLLADQRFFERKLAVLVPEPAPRARLRALLTRVGDGIQAYLWILTIVSALTAVTSYAVMRVVGLENAGFWAIVIFGLNFIPSIGSILGTVVPTAAALLQFQALGPAFVVLVGVGVLQFVIGNILLPRMSGNTLNISLFVTIFALFAWGVLWGFTGMFLAIPMTAALIIVFANFEATRPIAVILSQTGTFDPPTEPP